MDNRIKHHRLEQEHLVDLARTHQVLVAEVSLTVWLLRVGTYLVSQLQEETPFSKVEHNLAQVRKQLQGRIQVSSNSGQSLNLAG